MNPNATLSPINVSAQRAPTVPWGVRDVLFGIILAAGGVLALNGIALAIHFLAAYTIRDDSRALMLFVIVQDTVILGAASVFSLVRYRVGWNTLGLRRFDALLGCGWSFALLMASYAIRACYVITALLFGIKLQQQSIIPHLDVTGSGFALTFIAAAIVAPIVEEIFFRGFVYAGLRARLGVVGAVLISAVFFTGLHFTLDLFIPIFVLGLFLAWLYEKTGSLYPGIFLHATNNALAVIALFTARATGLAPI